MATPLLLERTYAVQGPNVVAWVKINAQGAVTSGVRLGTTDVSAAQATAYANAILAGVQGVADLQTQAAALYQRG
jgi:hypothetical protein